MNARSGSIARHPLSAAFPSMGDDELAALATDIKAHGLRQPIVLLGGEVLDGWHRYSACLLVGFEPEFVEFEGEDPFAFVISQNLHRRQLTSSQRAASIVACSEWRGLGANQHNRGSAPSAEALADAAEVSVRTIEHAKAATVAGLGDAVRDGKVSAKRAAEISKLPKEDWVAALQRKSDPKPPPDKPDETPDEDDRAETMRDLELDLAALQRIVDADDKLAAAWDEAKTIAAKYQQLEALYDAKCRELAEVQRDASRWMRKAQTLEKAARS